jgi:hypothetical protein
MNVARASRLRVCAWVALSVAVLSAAVACGERVEVGLANAPSLERKSEPKSQNDVITVGEEGCRNRDGGPSELASTAGCQTNTTASLIDGGVAPGR